MKIIFAYYKNYFKTLYKHKIDFFLNIFTVIFKQISSFLFIYVMKENIPDIYGWSINKIMLLNGIFLLNKGISDFITSGLYKLEDYIKNGTLDALLVKPFPVILQVLIGYVNIHEIINVLTGITLISIFLPKCVKQINVFVFLIIFIFIFISLFLIFSIRLITNSIAFWTLTSFPAARMVDNISNFAKFPSTIYNKVIRFVLDYIIPFSIIAFFPLVVILEKNISFILISVAITASLFFLSFLIWKIGLKNYKSSGN